MGLVEAEDELRNKAIGEYIYILLGGLGRENCF